MTKKRPTKKGKAKRWERPRLTVLVGCDHVAKDPNSGKATVYGVFDRLLVSDFSAGVSLRLYAKFAGGSGKHEFRFVLEDSRGNVFPEETDQDEAGIVLSCKKTGDIAVVATLVNVPVKRPGKYELVAFCDGERYEHSYPLAVQKVDK